jgi:hypothetical protein
MSITQTITDPGTAPTRTDPANFDSRADAFLTAIENYGGTTGEFALYAAQANALASDVNDDAIAAASAKTDAETARTQAQAAAAESAISANVTIFASGSTYPAGAVVMDVLDDYTLYTSQQNGNIGNLPSADDGTWWLPLIAEVEITPLSVAVADWPVTLSYTSGDLTSAVYAKGTERYKQTLNYDSGNLNTVLYQYSDDSGSNYTDIGTETLGYTNGNLTSTTWTAA